MTPTPLAFARDPPHKGEGDSQREHASSTTADLFCDQRITLQRVCPGTPAREGR